MEEKVKRRQEGGKTREGERKRKNVDAHQETKCSTKRKSNA